MHCAKSYSFSFVWISTITELQKTDGTVWATFNSECSKLINEGWAKKSQTLNLQLAEGGGRRLQGNPQQTRFSPDDVCSSWICSSHPTWSYMLSPIHLNTHSSLHTTGNETYQPLSHKRNKSHLKPPVNTIHHSNWAVWNPSDKHLQQEFMYRNQTVWGNLSAENWALDQEQMFSTAKHCLLFSKCCLNFV